MSSYLLTFLVSVIMSFGLILTKNIHGKVSLDTVFGVQKQHTEPTPRIGGIVIASGLFAGWWGVDTDVKVILGPMLIAGIPAFVFGLAEDLTKKVGVLPRLLATMASGVLAWHLTGVAMQDTGFAPLDWILRFLPVAILFTAFAVGGVANAINIIDGFNGLASGSVSIMSAALGLIAHNAGDMELSIVCLTLSTVALAFGCTNWPLGKIFLGDGGAYLLGFMLAWLAVLLPMRIANIHAWATMLVCAYPILEVTFSVARRHRREGHHPGQPDRAHLHHFIHRRIVCIYFPELSGTAKNALTSPICWVISMVPASLGIAFSEDTAALIYSFVLCTLGYFMLYTRLTQFRWCIRPSTLHSSRRSIK